MPRPKKVKNQATEVSEQTTKSPWNFFSEADFNQRGEVSSMIPAWACSQQIEDLLMSIEERESALEDHSLSPENRARLYKELEERKERYSMVTKKPKLDKDRIFKLVGRDHKGGELGDKIAESMFTNDDMTRGIPDASVELRRMTEPCIQLSPEEAEVASGCNVNITGDRKVSRDDAIKVWRFGRMYLDDITNPEVLRR
jgi:hypothetical protein